MVVVTFTRNYTRGRPKNEIFIRHKWSPKWAQPTTTRTPRTRRRRRACSRRHPRAIRSQTRSIGRVVSTTTICNRRRCWMIRCAFPRMTLQLWLWNKSTAMSITKPRSTKLYGKVNWVQCWANQCRAVTAISNQLTSSDKWKREPKPRPAPWKKRWVSPGRRSTQLPTLTEAKQVRS